MQEMPSTVLCIICPGVRPRLNVRNVCLWYCVSRPTILLAIFFHDNIYGTANDLIFLKLSASFSLYIPFFILLIFFLFCFCFVAMISSASSNAPDVTDVIQGRASIGRSDQHVPLMNDRLLSQSLTRNRVPIRRNSPIFRKSRHYARNIYQTCIANLGIAKLCNASVRFARECSHILKEIFSDIF